MRFDPKGRYKIFGEEGYAESIGNAISEMKSASVSGFLKTDADTEIKYEYFLCENAKKSIILVHGYSEFLQKMYEPAYYFLCMGYNVFLYDQRGHGLSTRAVSPCVLTHVDSFDDYVGDLEAYINNIVIPASEGADIYLFGHSMGGAVAALYLSKRENIIKKLILSSPMLCPKASDIPRKFILSAVNNYYIKRDGLKAMFPHVGGKFDPNPDYSRSFDTSYARFRYNLEYRLKDERYRNNCATNSWMRGAFSLQDELLRRDVASAIEAKVLILTAEKDKAVKNNIQRKYAKLLKNSELFVVKGAKHCLFTSNNAILEVYYKKIFEFLNK